MSKQVGTHTNFGQGTYFEGFKELTKHMKIVCCYCLSFWEKARENVLGWKAQAADSREHSQQQPTGPSGCDTGIEIFYQLILCLFLPCPLSN